jgi:hypothetical protein
MRKHPVKLDPAVHSFLMLRRMVGFTALCLPIALMIPWWAGQHSLLPSSVSSYYYTGMRDLFVGALCGIGIINMCCRGYDNHDTVAGILSGIFALGVAFFPTTPAGPVTRAQEIVGTIHIVSASLLFLTLAYFCFFLFTTSAHGHEITRRKLHRNWVYRVCGVFILASVVMIILFKVRHQEYLFGPLGAMFTFEATALFAFGVAWLVKGGAILKDEVKRERLLEKYTKEDAERHRKRDEELAGA